MYIWSFSWAVPPMHIGRMILVVVMFTIFEAYTKNNIMIEAQLRVDLG